ncbi:histidine permease [Drepanopeziza brunnea f. sp. 'multigermtubi' MB_m1]|uniref:Histidine permease n=1 Tax=Marssonina brunnea f. sp. multigermtubi (strain MB_m1) TaxID=1072389 RepID=K1XH89_MARBU|nr:histidine permease [Drepanopeziza brunnea f. sp. 'multigermtubi' MB_m1]EKD11839.1 histidine permease [Drepanopeziza brunnea f. sp. 'multigermtubi' MB_m1]
MPCVKTAKTNSVPKTSFSMEKDIPVYDVSDSDVGNIDVDDVEGLHRNLSGKRIQMITMGGSIGTALFVGIGSGLVQGGPGSLFIVFTLFSCWLALVNDCMAEMPVFMLVSGGFVRMGSKWVDEAFCLMLEWNFCLHEAILIPWKISALNLVLTFWRNDIPLAAVCAGYILLYGIINFFAVKWYGESKSWLSGGKLVLIIMLFCSTFVTMVGAKPLQREPLTTTTLFNSLQTLKIAKQRAFAEYVATVSLERFEGFLAALWKAAFTIVGTEYISMMAGEASHPRKNLKRAFKTIHLRFGLFFIGGALVYGIVIAHNDENRINALTDASASGAAAASPFVIAIYAASRTLYSLSLDGHAPRLLRKCAKKGVPIWCLSVTMIFPFLSFLALGSSSGQVIMWLANLTEASQIIDCICICWIYLHFYRALKVQGFDRRGLPYVGWAQPYCAWAGLGTMTFTVCWWDVGTLFSYYTVVFVCPILHIGWKVYWKTTPVRPEKANLVWKRPAIDAYEANMVEKTRSFWEQVGMMGGWHRKNPEHTE